MKGYEKLKAHLEKNGILQKWLASKLDITEPHLSVILSGTRGLSKRSKSIVSELWPDLDITDDVELLPEEKTAQDKEKAKNLFKD